MRQNASWTLEGLDPDTREAARQAARRAGMTIDEWVAATIAERTGRTYPERTYVEPPVRRRVVADDLDAAASKLARLGRRSTDGRDLEAIISAAATESERRHRDNTAKTAVALDSVARWIERTEDRMSETARATAERQERTNTVLGEALGLMTRRLEEIERKVVDGHQPSIMAALKAVEKIEHQIARQDEDRTSAQAAAIETALKSFEERIAEMGEKIAAAAQPKPIGRRGLDPREEIRSAVAEIRSRQSELEGEAAAPQPPRQLPHQPAPAAPHPSAQPHAAYQGPEAGYAAGAGAYPGGAPYAPAYPGQAPAPQQGFAAAYAVQPQSTAQPQGPAQAAGLTRSHADILLSLKGDIAKLAGQLDTVRPPADPYAPVMALREEIGRVQDRLGSLATRGEIGALENAIRHLTHHVADAREPADIAGVTGPIAELQAQVQRLSDVVAAGVHGRISLDLQALASKLDGVAESGIDPAVVDLLGQQLADVRRAVAEIAEPQRVQHLSEQVSELHRQIVQIGARQVDSLEFASVKSAIEDIRAAVRTPRPSDAESRETARHIEALSQKLDRLAEQTPRADMELLAQQFAFVAERLNELLRVNQQRSGSPDTAERLEGLLARLDARLDAPQPAPAVDMSFVADQFGHVTERFDQVADSLADLRRALPRTDASGLASRIETLSQKLDRLAEGPSPSIISREIERLASRLDGALVSVGSPAAIEPLIERLDRLDETIRRPREEAGLKPIEEMLGQLAEKLTQAERPGAGMDALDALERQVGEIARRLERNAGQDPTLTALERAMGDLMAQVETLRSGTSEAVERAAKTAVAQTLSSLPKAAPAQPAPEFGTLKRELADLKAHHSASDKRTHETLEAVHTTLEKVVARLGSLEPDAVREKPSPRPPRDQAAREAAAREAAAREQAARETAAPARPGSTSDLLQEAMKQLQAGSPRPAGSSRSAASLLEADRPAPPRSEEILLEPGAERPRRDAAPRTEAPEPKIEAGDIKAQFIAQARRAAQAAAAEAAAAEAAAPKGRGARLRELGALADFAAARNGLGARLKDTYDRRRRPILMGIAAILLALGSIQLGTRMLSSGGDTLTASAPAPSSGAPASLAGASPREVPASDIVEPRTTQSVPGKTEGGLGPASQRDPGTALAALPAPRTEPAARAAAGPSMTGSLGMTLPQAAAGAAPTIVPAGTTPAAPPAAEPAPQASPKAPPPAIERIAGMASVEIPVTVTPGGLRQAALAGDPAAVFELASRAADGRGMGRDPKLAARLFEKAAAHGLAPAQYRIGNLYEKGTGVARDLGLAKLWYQRAAEKGNARAMHNLAVLLAEGAGGKPDYAGAVEWFRRAAEHGVRDSQFNLAVLTARGLGTAQDLAQSYTWFAVAAGQGDEDAAKKRDEVAGRLAAADLASAKAAADRWKPEAANPVANDVALPANGWPEAPAQAASPAPAAKKSNRV